MSSKLIVAATDGSPAGGRVIDCAAELGAGLGAEVLVVHVRGSGDVPEALRHMAESEHLIDRPAGGGETPLSSAPGPDNRRAALELENRQIHDFVAGHVLRAAADVLQDRGVKLREARVLDGDPADAILAAVAQHRADMVVVGSRGLGALRAILGSVSYKVTQLAPCTCVVVK